MSQEGKGAAALRHSEAEAKARSRCPSASPISLPQPTPSPLEINFLVFWWGELKAVWDGEKVDLYNVNTKQIAHWVILTKYV